MNAVSLATEAGAFFEKKGQQRLATGKSSKVCIWRTSINGSRSNVARGLKSETLGIAEMGPAGSWKSYNAVGSMWR